MLQYLKSLYFGTCTTLHCLNYCGSSSSLLFLLKCMVIYISVSFQICKHLVGHTLSEFLRDFLVDGSELGIVQFPCNPPTSEQLQILPSPLSLSKAHLQRSVLVGLNLFGLQTKFRNVKASANTWFKRGITLFLIVGFQSSVVEMDLFFALVLNNWVTGGRDMSLSDFLPGLSWLTYGDRDGSQF